MAGLPWAGLCSRAWAKYRQVPSFHARELRLDPSLGLRVDRPVRGGRACRGASFRLDLRGLDPQGRRAERSRRRERGRGSLCK